MKLFRIRQTRHDTKARIIPFIRNFRWSFAIAVCSSMLALLVVAQVPAVSMLMTRAPVSAQQIADFESKLLQYNESFLQFENASDRYWISFNMKEHLRDIKRSLGEPTIHEDYVITPPPIYTGPAKPIDPALLPAGN